MQTNIHDRLYDNSSDYVRNIKSYFTSIEQNETNETPGSLKQELSLDIYYSSCFVEYPLYPIEYCLAHLRSSVLEDS